MGVITGDAASVARLVQVQQSQPELGEREQVVARVGEEVEVLGREPRADGDESVMVDQSAKAAGLLAPRGGLVRADQHGLQVLT
ncbi:hypothetical protein GCM10018965_072740 [Nonomuraea roseola]